MTRRITPEALIALEFRGPPFHRAAMAVLRLAAVVALYLLRTVLAPSGTLRGLRQMVLDADPVPGMTGVRRACGEPLP